VAVAKTTQLTVASYVGIMIELVSLSKSSALLLIILQNTQMLQLFTKIIKTIFTKEYARGHQWSQMCYATFI
jgi:hypothetical protein